MPMTNAEYQRRWRKAHPKERAELLRRYRKRVRARQLALIALHDKAWPEWRANLIRTRYRCADCWRPAKVALNPTPSAGRSAYQPFCGEAECFNTLEERAEAAGRYVHYKDPDWRPYRKGR